MDCFIHCCGGKTEEEYQLKEKELAARSKELKSEQDNSFKLSKNLEEETKSKNAEIKLKQEEETAKKKAITRGHMELMGKKITAVMKDQKTEKISELVSEMEKLQQMMEDERQAHAAEKAAMEKVQKGLEADKAALEQRVRNFQQALAKTGGESLRLCRELSDDSVAPWVQAEKTAGLANIVSDDLSASLRGGPQWENLAPPSPPGVPPAAAKLEPKVSPMHSACREGDKKKVKGILRDLRKQSLVDECLSSKDRDGKTPLDLCIANGHSELHEYLVSKGSQDRNDDDNDPLPNDPLSSVMASLDHIAPHPVVGEHSGTRDSSDALDQLPYEVSTATDPFSNVLVTLDHIAPKLTTFPIQIEQVSADSPAQPPLGASQQEPQVQPPWLQNRTTSENEKRDIMAYVTQAARAKILKTMPSGMSS